MWLAGQHTSRRTCACAYAKGVTGARWPDTWLPEGADAATALRFSRRWVNVHADVCTSTLGKPLVLTEFGTKADGRPAFYEKACAGPNKQAYLSRLGQHEKL